MPHSLFSTDTDLTAENLLRLPAEFGCPGVCCRRTQILVSACVYAALRSSISEISSLRSA